MTTRRDHHPDAVQRLDWASLTLLGIGITTGLFTLWLTAHGHLNPTLLAAALAPSVTATTLGARHATKWVLPHDTAEPTT